MITKASGHQTRRPLQASLCSADFTSGFHSELQLQLRTATSAQNCNFSATCETRPGCDFRIWPKVASSRLPSTEPAPSNCEWLKVLKVSKRNSSEVDSVIRVSLRKATS